MPDSLAAIHTSAGILAGAPARKPAAMTLALAVALATGLFAVPPAQARPEMAGQNAEARFDAMDANKDGKVSREEFFAAQPNMKEGAFAAIDADGDGALTLKEWKDFSAGHGKEGGMGAMGAMPPSAPGDAAAPDAGKGDAPGQPQGAPTLIMPPPGLK